ncbi:hypothetical protein [Hyphomicrobium sp.]|uniref:hypothetical protein n=1 Tax=Hyphomicrobium sp. TaxID=82 RepID=UPI002CA96207|nr:hypothetical protein [Hyphomicrobium sp.]HRN88365.1 hypothetical protein [Hyphomicrobium sp.]HRQ26034.1 hypothetical protein [Hyphomicrobium sp.]
MSINGLCARVKFLITPAIAVSAFAIVSGTSAALAAGKLIAVEWTDPEIKSFVSERRDAARSLGPTADDQLAKLQLPVLAFDSTPGIVEKTLNIGPRPAVERDVVMDEAEPVWYQLVERYGDVTVSVSADLRVQHEFPEGAIKLYTDESRGAAPTAGPAVSVFDETDYGGEEGFLAEYTITRFGVPYTVTVECSEEAKDQCRDTTQISKDSELLTLIRANPPAPAEPQE